MAALYLAGIVTACSASQSAEAINLEQVNKTPCKADGDCTTVSTNCQSGCSLVAINRRSPLYARFVAQRLAADKCCRKGAKCPTTACHQERIHPRCQARRCVLTSTPPPMKVSYYLSARASRQCRNKKEMQRELAAEKKRLSKVKGLIIEMQHAAILRASLRDLSNACIPKRIKTFFEQQPWAGKSVWFKSTQAVCEACGCFEPSFFCIKAVTWNEGFKKLGYGRVREGVHQP